MIQRVNIVKENGEYKLKFPNGRIPNWLVGIYKDTLGFMAFSKAGKGKEFAWRIKCQEGSLFLANNTNNFYWYFREKENQRILDKLGIIKVINTEFPVFELHFRYTSGTITNPIIEGNGNIVYSEETSTNKLRRNTVLILLKKLVIWSRKMAATPFKKGKTIKAKFFICIILQLKTLLS